MQCVVVTDKRTGKELMATSSIPVSSRKIDQVRKDCEVNSLISKINYDLEDTDAFISYKAPPTLTKGVSKL